MATWVSFQVLNCSLTFVLSRM